MYPCVEGEEEMGRKNVDKNLIRVLYINGLTVGDIASKMSLTKQTVYKYIKDISTNNHISNDMIINSLISENNELKLRLIALKKENVSLKETIFNVTNELNERNRDCFDLLDENKYLRKIIK